MSKQCVPTKDKPEGVSNVGDILVATLPKTNMDTQNNGLEKLSPFKHGNFWYLC